MRIVIGADIKIIDPTKEMGEWIEKTLTVRNPKYYSSMNRGISDERISPTLEFFRKEHNYYNIPFGMLRDVYAMCKDKSIVEFNYTYNEDVNYISKIDLRSYQTEPVNLALKQKNGLIIMPCGSGKTVTGCAIIGKFHKPALWITHTKDLLDQSKKCAEKNIVCDIPFGLISEGKCDISKSITFATVQTLVRMNLEDIARCWDVIIVDEAHRAFMDEETSAMFCKILNTLEARVKIGLTATLHRGDKMESTVEFLFGRSFFELDESEIKSSLTENVYVQPVYFNTKDSKQIYDINGVVDSKKTLDYLISQDIRNIAIVSKLVENKDHYCLVLSDRIDHLKNLSTLLEKQYSINSVFLTGKTKTKDRVEGLQMVREGQINYLFATYALAKEGLDIPILDRLFLVTPKRDYTILVQSVGRIRRKYFEKDDARIYDFIDVKIPHLYRNAKVRYDIYASKSFAFNEPIKINVQ